MAAAMDLLVLLPVCDDSSSARGLSDEHVCVLSGACVPSQTGVEEEVSPSGSGLVVFRSAEESKFPSGSCGDPASSCPLSTCARILRIPR